MLWIKMDTGNKRKQYEGIYYLWQCLSDHPGLHFYVHFYEFKLQWMVLTDPASSLAEAHESLGMISFSPLRLH